MADQIAPLQTDAYGTTTFEKIQNFEVQEPISKSMPAPQSFQHRSASGNWLKDPISSKQPVRSRYSSKPNTRRPGKMAS